MTDISSLGYVRIRSRDMEPWRAFAYEAIGFAEGSGPEQDALYLRMDERPGRIVILPGDEDRVEAVGWEVRDHLALQRVQAAVEDAGVAVKPLSAPDTAARRVEEAISFLAPGGTPVEVFHGPALDHSPLNTPYGNRFVTEGVGAGHVVVPVGDMEAARRFYESLGFLARGGFRLPTPPDVDPMYIRFMGVNARHHSLALMPTPDLQSPALVHIMVECETLDEVGRALDRVTSAGYHISSTLGRHTNDKMVSFYVRTPGGWDLEVGCWGLLVDEQTYTAEEITADSYWGHHWDFS
ncbi:VOC family protein [Streptomyces sp. ID03-2B]|uniref:VOC family protein n=1 Tax=Streptomyces caviscabies TaxID=90079 RepID=A0ABW2MDD7_9ACTN|nr:MULTISPECIES: VOC family protein [unclassified Streptomyces]MCL6289139.1 VOC family protein [Streptomyces sp. 43Y-GA-1]MDX3339041.1 VOC family protein [Streptomyces sp. ME02-6979.5a]MDX3506408.1 VOC family protein [Streptomyces sp. ATCC51928]MDX3589885.1 VOC family protein [Streptomyces sp. ID03-2B]MDX5522255.1 VOC family protein [Streptomyces sp. DE06-01C]